MELLSGFGKRGVELGLLSKKVDIEDTEYLSKYFILQEFSPKLTAGKNSITFNGSEFLKKESEILVECLDSSGEPLYIESAFKTNIAYRESSTYVLSIHVYSETYNGPGKLVFYGVLNTGATVRWVGNVQIDKTNQNTSTVRFYNKPTLDVFSVLSPVISSVGDLNKTIEFTGSFYSHAVTPLKDTLTINKRNVDIDYRIYGRNFPPFSDPTGSFNSQIRGSKIDLHIRTIQEPYSYKNLDVNITSSFTIKNVLNDYTLVLGDLISYKHKDKKEVVVNVVDGDFHIRYPYVVYNTSSENSNYLSVDTSDGRVTVKQSYADVVYRNLKTFSGFISRQKLYRKSLFSTGDFEVISDEPLTAYELLVDKITLNKSFDKMGSFYNKTHVDKYWFPNGELVELTQSSQRFVDGMVINYTGSKIDLDSLDNYVIVKENSSYINRTPTYYPYNSVEFSSTSGSAYDSNFVELRKNVSYIISLNAVLIKDSSTLNESDSGLEFYFTSSMSDINLESSVVRQQPGLMKIGVVSAYEPQKEKLYNPTSFLFTPTHDLYGTLIIVPRKCTAVISELSFKPYGDFAFSPDILITRIPFPINVANEAFEIKAELFDIHSNLVYSDLRTITSFDASGSSLTTFIPGLKDPSKTDFISGSLEISQSLWVGENVYITGSLRLKGTLQLDKIHESTYNKERLLAWNPSTNQIAYTNIGDADYQSEMVKLSLFVKNEYAIGSENPVGTLLSTFRLLPSIEGRNIFVEPK